MGHLIGEEHGKKTHLGRVLKLNPKYVKPRFMQSVSIQSDNTEAKYSGVHLTHHHSHSSPTCQQKVSGMRVEIRRQLGSFVLLSFSSFFLSWEGYNYPSAYRWTSLRAFVLPEHAASFREPQQNWALNSSSTQTETGESGVEEHTQNASDHTKTSTVWNCQSAIT